MDETQTELEIIPMQEKLHPEEHVKVKAWLNQLGEAVKMMMDNPRIVLSGYDQVLPKILTAIDEGTSVPSAET